MSEDKDRCAICGNKISEKRLKRHPGSGCVPRVRTCETHAGKMMYMGHKRPPAIYKVKHLKGSQEDRREWIKD